jgi:hypothetical protein
MTSLPPRPGARVAPCSAGPSALRGRLSVRWRTLPDIAPESATFSGARDSV